MASIAPSRELKVSLIDPFTIGTGHSVIRISYGGADFLDLTLQRKFRVPEDGKRYNNKAQNGSMPIYSVEQFNAKLPSDVKEKRGLAVPIFNREAVSLHFKSSRPYAIKVFVGDNNAISGEPKVETTSTSIRRKHRLTVGETIQDYYVAGEPWLDTFRTLTGNCKQFVCGTPALKIQAMPKRRVGMCIMVQMFEGEGVSKFMVEGLEAAMKVGELKARVEDLKGIGVKKQMLIWSGKQLDDAKSLYEYEVQDRNTINLLIKEDLVDSDNGSVISSAASSIDREDTFEKKMNKVQLEDWEKENTIIFNINLINATEFEHLLGIKTKTPLTMIMYKAVGIPVTWEVYNESKIATPPPSEEMADGASASFDAVALSKTNKKLLSLPIALNSGLAMPEFLLEYEMIAKIKAMNANERGTYAESYRRGSTSSGSSFAGHSFVDGGSGRRRSSSLRRCGETEPFPEF